MLTVETILEARSDAKSISQELSPQDLRSLVTLLSEKDNELRYCALLLLQHRSRTSPDVYPFWDELRVKLSGENSYQRSVGILLLAENVRWDGERRLDGILDEYLSHCRDERFITARQTIQSVGVWLKNRPDLVPRVGRSLMGVDIASFKDTQRKLILADIVGVLLEAQRISPEEAAEEYIRRALTGGVLDKKTVKELTAAR